VNTPRFKKKPQKQTLKKGGELEEAKSQIAGAIERVTGDPKGETAGVKKRGET